ncbi:MAG: hypothetical protein DRJ98_06225, partial [Thermoprotei archaeon]
MYFWVPCEAAGETGIAVRMIYPHEPRYSEGAPVVVYVPGGIHGGYFSILSQDYDPQGLIWLEFLFPGGSHEGFSSGGNYDYRGEACLAALYAVLQFAQGKLTNAAGKYIRDYVDYEVLTNDVGLYGSSYGGVISALVFAKYSSGLEGVKYIVFYESPPCCYFATTDLGRVADDPNPSFDADGDGLPWNDYRNPNYVLYTASEEGCTINFSTLRYDPEVGLYLDNDGNGEPTYVVSDGRKVTDVDGSGAIEADEDYILPYWSLDLWGRKVYSALVMEGASQQGLLDQLSEDYLSLEETRAFWEWRELSPHYDEVAANAPWLKVMELAFLKEHMMPAPDYSNVVINYNAFKSRGLWVRLNPDKCYLEYVLGRTVEWEDNDALVDVNFDNVKDMVISDDRANLVSRERKLVEVASVLEMADRVYYDCWDGNLEEVLTAQSNVPST